MERYAAVIACLLIVSAPSTRAGIPPAPAARDSQLEQQALLRLESRIAKAQLDRDFKFLESVFAGDMLYIGSDGRTSSRQEYLQQLKNNRVYSEYLNKDVEVRVFGDVAIADGVQKVSGTFDGRKTSGSFVSSKVWAYRAQRWQIVRWQSTLAPPPSPEALLKKLQTR